MEAGENHEVDTMFPPMPSTIIGAIRTAILGRQGIDPADYLNDTDNCLKTYPILGKPAKAGFELIGPLFQIKEELLLPVPASWYSDLDDNMEWNREYAVQTATPLDKPLFDFCGSNVAPFWLKNPLNNDMKPLNGYWATMKAFTAVKEGRKITFCNLPEQLQANQTAILPSTALFAREERVGLALTRQRTAKEGHLYTAVHIRLQDEVKIVVGISSEHDVCLTEDGILQLGGEQRVCRYHFLTDLTLPENPGSENLLALSPIPLPGLSSELADCPRASGKLLRIGGWDMEKKFHKPMTAWLPAGTIFHAENNTNPVQFLAI